MPSFFRAMIPVAVLPLSCTTASTMSDAHPHPIQCTVVNPGKLSSQSYNPDMICNAIRRAAADEGIAQPFVVEVRVVSPTLVVAQATTTSGRSLPEQRLVSADRDVGTRSIERFARSLVRLMKEAV